VTSGEANYNGVNMSQLLPVQYDVLYPVDSGTTQHVWQGYRKNWVSESGAVSVYDGTWATPIIASGVYINGNFHQPRVFDGTSGIAIDRRNGRVIIESGIPAGYAVVAPHSVKEVWVDTISRDLISNQITAVDNTKRVIVNNAPSGEISQVPMVLMEIADMGSPNGLQLGAGIIYRPTVNLHVVAGTRYDKDEIVDALMRRVYNTMLMVDLDRAETSGALFTFYGNYSSGYKTYGELQTLFFDRNAFIGGVSLVANNDIAQEGYYTALVKMELRLDIEEVI
ncbi:MAG: hypothetical protein MN733_24025, partial [Nitrososphaera sp.]|nr:hypothetical protein [Nitrososphaera sp.]